MKKRKQGKTLSRTATQRLALLRTLTVSLVEHEKIITTLAKAKSVRPFAERIINRAKRVYAGKSKVAVLRHLKEDLPDKAVAKVMNLAEKYKNRSGGYLRIIKLVPRERDAAEMAVIELVKEDIKQFVGNREEKKQGSGKSQTDQESREIDSQDKMNKTASEEKDKLKEENKEKIVKEKEDKSKEDAKNKKAKNKRNNQASVSNEENKGNNNQAKKEAGEKVSTTNSNETEKDKKEKH